MPHSFELLFNPPMALCRNCSHWKTCEGARTIRESTRESCLGTLQIAHTPWARQHEIAYTQVFHWPVESRTWGTVVSSPSWSDDGYMRVTVKFRENDDDPDSKDFLKGFKLNQLEPCGQIFGLEKPAKRQYFEWKHESKCVFTCSKGFQHVFDIFFPPEFRAWLDAMEQASELSRRAWPMLMALHGSGGGSHMGNTRKSIRSIGLQHCAKKFVVISPCCEWTWSQVPDQWIDDLFLYLRGAFWVDPERTYITGHSMGGMGTWEVGARLSNVVAAIAPVAAHHQPERRKHLVPPLLNTPVLAVHSMSDTTCPLQPEEALLLVCKRRPRCKDVAGYFPTCHYRNENSMFLAGSRHSSCVHRNQSEYKCYLIFNCFLLHEKVPGRFARFQARISELVASKIVEVKMLAAALLFLFVTNKLFPSISILVT